MDYSQMLKGLLEGCILELIAKKPSYPYQMIKDLEQYHFFDLSEGTIYPLLLRLQKKDLIRSKLINSKIGPSRKYYFLTASGIEQLTKFKTHWLQLKKSIDLVLEEK